MAVFTRDCPHCSAFKAQFTFSGSSQHPNDRRSYECLAICPGCHGGIVVRVVTANAQGAVNPTQVAGDLASSPHGAVTHVWPKPVSKSIPAHIPERVAKAFKEGCDVMKASPSAACAQFRKALEWGLKDLAPDVDAWRLEKRIDKLAAEGKLTTALQEWAHQLRIDGNEAVHGEEDPTQEHAQAIEQFTRYVLTYLFTLPKDIELARDAENK